MHSFESLVIILTLSRDPLKNFRESGPTAGKSNVQIPLSGSDGLLPGSKSGRVGSGRARVVEFGSKWSDG